MPELGHIWIQLGHARKECGDLNGARDAYERALRSSEVTDAQAIEAARWAAAAAELQGDAAHAFTLGLTGLRRGDRGLATLAALLRNLPATARGGPILTEIAAACDLALPVAVPAAGERDPTLFLDVGDLLSHCAQARRPSGIQRVQSEVACAAIEQRADVALCCRAPAERGWKRLDSTLFEELTALSLDGDDADSAGWQRAVLAAHLAVAALPTLRFPPSATLLNLGNGWADPHYFEDVWAYRKRAPLTLVATVYDLIPLAVPALVPTIMTEACADWLAKAVKCCDGFIAISQASAADLRRFAGEAGAQLDERAIAVAPLDADFRRPNRQQLELAALDRWQLRPNGFVLFVATVEPRKNSEGALQAWHLLVERLGPESAPVLVLAGRAGWHSRGALDLLAAAGAEGRTMMLSGLSDRELDLLYRNCLFTLYPSLYEGWGLPVTESLCYGKVPVSGSGSALVEAGDTYAIYVDAADPESIATAAAELVMQPDLRKARERAISAHFRPRSWREIAMQMLDHARQFSGLRKTPG
jgi:glycosyltransferase involved in cell wall biosynthesis